ncbi:MAG: hypothetical protein K2M16_10190, partial [Muribaculaceae bacterium]|nr:hypothetical protein [Muribaculaceae bacterium]
MKKLILVLSIILLCLPEAFAAKPKETPEQKRAEEIRNMPDLFIFGSGVGGDAEEAYNAAVFDMVKQISQKVSGRTSMETTNQLKADGTVETTEQFSSVVESYTTPASLEGVQVIAIGGAPDFERFVYMPRENIRKMHERRRKNVADLARNGIAARDKGKVDDALRHLYRAYVLLQSLPNASEVE